MSRWPPLLDRLKARTEVQSNGCHHWTGVVNDLGYGRVYALGRQWQVHRLFYALFVGELSPQLDVDHTCHDPRSCAGGTECLHRRCVNPAHLEQVTRTENNRRGALGFGRNGMNARTHCPRGHQYDHEIGPRKHRRCRKCLAEAQRRYRARKGGESHY